MSTGMTPKIGSFVQYSGHRPKPLEYIAQDGRRETFQPIMLVSGVAVYTGPLAFVEQNLSRHPEMYRLWQTPAFEIKVATHAGGQQWEKIYPWAIRMKNGEIEWYEDKEEETVPAAEEGRRDVDADSAKIFETITRRLAKNQTALDEAQNMLAALSKECEHVGKQISVLSSRVKKLEDVKQEKG